MFRLQEVSKITTLYPFLALSIFFAGCASSSPNTITLEKKTDNKKFYLQTEKPMYTLDVWITDKGIQILGTRPYNAMRKGVKPVPEKTPNSLKWVIKSNSGKPIAIGYIRDPRIAQAIVDKNGHHSGRFKEKIANFSLDVPTNKGTLFLYENHSTF